MFPPYPPQPIDQYPDSPDSSPSHFQTQQITPSAITATYPPVVTADNHGFTNGQTVRATKFYPTPFAVATGMYQLNNNQYYVQEATTDTFALYDRNGQAIDGRNFTPYIQGGQFTRTGQDLFTENPSPPPPPGIPGVF